MKLILFDLDGTLVDSAPAVAEAINRVRARKDLESVSEEVVRASFSATEAERGPQSLLVPPDASGKTRRDALLLFGSYQQEAFQSHVALFPGVLDLLEALRKRGIQVGVLSNRLSLFLYEILQHAGLEGKLDPVLGADAVAQPPPAPDLVQLALAQTGIAAAEALVIAYGQAELNAARAADVNTAFAAYGYGAAPTWMPDAILKEPADLLALL
jgi:phosphoglycolate phosphatase